MADDIYTVRIEKSLMERIDGYSKSQEVTRSEAFRSLLQLGLSLHDLKEDNTADSEEEFKKMMVDILIRVTQQFLFDASSQSKELVQSTSSKAKSYIQEMYPFVAEKYAEILSIKS